VNVIRMSGRGQTGSFAPIFRVPRNHGAIAARVTAFELLDPVESESTRAATYGSTRP
jgi:hypothetical protein